jgi:hypothetical protein
MPGNLGERPRCGHCVVAICRTRTKNAPAAFLACPVSQNEKSRRYRRPVGTPSRKLARCLADSVTVNETGPRHLVPPALRGLCCLLRRERGQHPLDRGEVPYPIGEQVRFRLDALQQEPHALR